MPKWVPLEGNLATPVGFLGAGVAAGIKKVHGALDLALIFSDALDTTSAGVFTTNRVVAAPVVLSRQNLRASGGRARAIIVNSGNANACTGRTGYRTAQETARSVAKALGISESEVLVASTGVIGLPLKPELILNRIPALQKSLSVENASHVARAIMTTDTFPKTYVLRARIDGTSVTLAGIAKGAGMIHPRMATLLSFITTDAAVPPTLLDKMLRAAVAPSFNSVTIDGDTSTNDTVIVLASGRSGVFIRPGSKAADAFLAGLEELCQALARMIARDGEGAKKLITIDVRGARTDADADRVARAIANSPLVKTAVAGSDPNWGRILCAAGYAGANFDPAKVDIRVNGLFLCRRGLDAAFDEAVAKRELEQKEITLRVDLHQGKAAARIWTCDLTHDYITINASYRT
jgi:glutamate N-acetyltransferase / amino-acid N-acetyltransferase